MCDYYICRALPAKPHHESAVSKKVDPIRKAELRLSLNQQRAFQTQCARLRKLAHFLDIETTSDGRLRFLISHAGWFRHIYSLEDVVEFTDHALARSEVAKARRRVR